MPSSVQVRAEIITIHNILAKAAEGKKDEGNLQTLEKIFLAMIYELRSSQRNLVLRKKTCNVSNYEFEFGIVQIAFTVSGSSSSAVHKRFLSTFHLTLYDEDEKKKTAIWKNMLINH
ncbi:CLUMA_CG006726, isoform A [Clunio marinus]|uniref:CLUMA_CG006726, isoform A n=1 Tax=Clunio marinus TaxID=568069 RepID=A0A1J1I2V0_9DIPT|nr:CLUMA_CG006726, isoform A [Clunio marinus]